MGNSCAGPQKVPSKSAGTNGAAPQIENKARDQVVTDTTQLHATIAPDVKKSAAVPVNVNHMLDQDVEGSKAASTAYTEGSDHDVTSVSRGGDTEDFDANEVEKAEFVVSLGNFMHLMQRERGISAIFVESGESKEKVKAIRKATSAMWKSLGKDAIDPVLEILDLIGMERLKSEYPQVERRKLNYLKVILEMYNPALEQIMTAINRASKNLKSTAIGGEVNSHIAFLSLKEAVGRERALVGGALGHRAMSSASYRELLLLLGMQSSFETMFEVSAPADLLQMYHQTCTKPDKVFEVEEQILSSLDGIAGVPPEMNPTAWYDLLTLRIDRMEKIRQALAEDIRKGVMDGVSLRAKSRAMELKRTLEHLDTAGGGGHSGSGGGDNGNPSGGREGRPSADLGPGGKHQGSRGKMRSKNSSKSGGKDKWLIDSDDIELIEEIGKGSTGSTYRASWHGTPVAVKVVDDALAVKSRKNTALKEFKVEVEILSRLRHPNICLYLGAAVQHPRYCLVLEYMKGGTVFDVVRTDPEAVDFFRCALDVARAMQYVHDHCKMMHRDLKTPNLLCDETGTVKIADFGLSCLEDRENKMAKTGEIGTYRWMAPEVIMHEPYGTPADVYSYGIVLWELLTAKMPFKGLSPIKAAMGVVVEQLRPTLPEGTPNGVMSLVSSCWAPSPEDRPSFRDIVDMLESLEKKEGEEARKVVPGMRRDPARPTYSYLGLGGDPQSASAAPAKGDALSAVSNHFSSGWQAAGDAGSSSEPSRESVSRDPNRPADT